MKEEFLIFPLVRSLVSRLAGCAQVCGLAAAATAAAELVLAPLGFIPAALFVGQASGLLFALFLSSISPLAPWCHEVLLAHRGRGFSRFLLMPGVMLGLLLLAGQVCFLLTGQLMLLRQGEIPLMISLLLSVCIWINIPLMAAAPLLLRLRLAAFPLMLLATAVTDDPSLVAINNLCRILTVLLVASPLLRLKRIAPRIVSLP